MCRKKRDEHIFSAFGYVRSAGCMCISECAGRQNGVARLKSICTRLLSILSAKSMLFFFFFFLFFIYCCCCWFRFLVLVCDEFIDFFQQFQQCELLCLSVTVFYGRVHANFFKLPKKERNKAKCEQASQLHRTNIYSALF